MSLLLARELFDQTRQELTLWINIHTLEVLWWKKKKKRERNTKEIGFRMFYFLRSFLLPQQKIMIIVLHSI